MRVAFITLGCKVNQYETQAMETLLTERGHQVVGPEDQAEVWVINTCAVTAESGRKSRQAVRRVRKDHPGAVVAVCGCFSQISPADTAALGADLVAGSGHRLQFLEDLETVYQERRQLVRQDDPMKRRQIETLPAGGLLGRTRAMLKIQDGCNNFCSYCIIPYARGPVRSLPLDQVEAQAAGLLAAGYREIVLTGIEIASYGIDLPGRPGLDGAVAAAGRGAPGLRLRLGSLEPRVVTEAFCQVLAGLPGLCPHFHLSLQSGCDATLARMRRRYDTETFYQVVQRLRRYFPNCGITGDLIVGFPGETEAEFETTLAFIRQCQFSALHVFPYSRRPGTLADKMEGQVTAAVKKERAAVAGAAAAEMEAAFLQSQVGKTLQVLFETEQDGRSTGHSENYCLVTAPIRDMHNIVAPVRILGVENGGLVGQA